MSESPWKSNWSTIPPAQVESWSRLLIFIVAMGWKPVHHPFWGEKYGRPKNAQQEKNTGPFFVIQHLGMANRIELNEFVIRISPGGVKCNAFGREGWPLQNGKKNKTHEENCKMDIRQKHLHYQMRSRSWPPEGMPKLGTKQQFTGWKFSTPSSSPSSSATKDFSNPWLALPCPRKTHRFP